MIGSLFFCQKKNIMFQNHSQLKPFIISSLAFLLCTIAVDTIAQPCYAIAVDNVEIDIKSHLVEFDIEQGYTKYIAEVDANIKAIAIDPATGKIYTARFNEFGTLNPITGQFEKLSILGTMDGEYGTFIPDSIRAMAFNPLEDIIYAVDYNFSKIGSPPWSEDLLFKINPVTGNIIRESMYIDRTETVTDYAAIEVIEDGTLKHNTLEDETFRRNTLHYPVRDVWDITINSYTGELLAHHRTGVYAMLTILDTETGQIDAEVADVSFKDYLGVAYSRDGNLLYLTSEEEPYILYERLIFGNQVSDQGVAGFFNVQDFVFKTIDCGLAQYLPYQTCKFEIEITNMMKQQRTYEAQEVINSNLYVNSDIEFYAGTSINLFSGFEVKADADFGAYISNCN